MGPTYLEVHPVYGAIYKDGEFVQRGAVLGLSVDSKSVVVAPVSGWVRLVPHEGRASTTESNLALRLAILQEADADTSASLKPL